MAEKKNRKGKRKGTGMKGLTIKGGHKRSTESGAGMTEKGVRAYRRKNPGSKLKTAVTEKSPSKARAKRRKSFCARSAGQMKKFPKAAKDPNSKETILNQLCVKECLVQSNQDQKVVDLGNGRQEKPSY
jgi:hypothetical protein